MDSEDRVKIATHLDETYLVEAGAGTGKTYAMVQRIIEIIAKDKAKLPQIVAITFTEKAAQELKTRIKDRLEMHRQLANQDLQLAQKQMADFENQHILNPQSQPNYEDMLKIYSEKLEEANRQDNLFYQALLDMDHAEITTIHGFCSCLLREQPLQAKVDMAFEVASQAWANRLFEQAWEEWISDQLQQANPFLLELLRADITEFQLHKLAQDLTRYRELIENFIPQYDPVDLKDFSKWLKIEFSQLELMLPACKNPTQDKGYQQLSPLIQDWLHWTSQSTEEFQRRLLYEIKINTRAGDQNNWSPKTTLAKIKTNLAEIKARLEAISLSVKHNLMQKCVVWLKTFLECYHNLKRQKKLLDFEDLLNYTRNLLRDNLEVRNALQQHYRFLLVDEFQDTDPLQAEILFFLAEETPIAKCWQEVKLKPGKLFVVGDPKQSIYRFRRADIEIYQEVKQLAGQHLKIVKNFRSKPEIIEWINHCFSHLIQEAGAYQPAYIPLVSERDMSSGSAVSASSGSAVSNSREPMISPTNLSIPQRGAVYFIKTQETSLREEEEDKSTVEAISKKEAYSIAHTIQDIITQKWPIQERQHDNPREIQYSDITILMRNFTYLQEIEQALAYYKIPYQVIGGKSYYNRIEVHSIISLLQALLEPYNTIAVLAVLRSPIFTVSDQNVLLYYEKYHTLDYRKWEYGEDYLGKVSKILNELHQQIGYLSGPDFLDLIFEKTGMLTIFFSMPQGEQKVANLIKIQQLAYYLTKLGLEDFRRFVQYLIELRQKEEDESESNWNEEGSKTVRIMTIHRSKGLEFPAVFLAGLAVCPLFFSIAMIADRQQQHIELCLKGKVELKTKGYDQAFLLEKEKIVSEEKRLLYVAVTRACDYLFIPSISNPRANSYGEWLAEFLVSELGYGQDYWIIKSKELSYSLSLRPLDQINPLLQSHDWKSAWQEWQQQHQQIIQRGNCRQTSYNFYLPPAGQQITIEWSRRELLRTLLEKILENYSIWKTTNQMNIAFLFQAWLEPEIEQYQITDIEQNQIIQSAIQLLKSPLLQRVTKAQSYWFALPISWLHNEQWLEVKIPIVFVEHDKLYFVLYKNDFLQENVDDLFEIANIYREEATIYAIALQKITKLIVKEAIIYFWESNQAYGLAVKTENFEDSDTSD